MSLLLPGDGRGQVRVDLPRQVLELRGRRGRAALEEDGRVFLREPVQAQLLVYVEGSLRNKLRQLLRNVIVVRSLMNYKVLVE